MKLFLPLLTVLLTSLPAFSAELHGVTLPDSVKVNDKTLSLNGLGTRIKYVFKVYVAGLYLDQKSSDSRAILDSSGPKRLDMQFLRDVDVESIQKAWREGVEKNCEADCKALEGPVQTLNSYMEAMKERDKMGFVFLPTGVEVHVKGQLKGTVPGLSKNLLAVFIGKNPPNKELRDGLLNIK